VSATRIEGLRAWIPSKPEGLMSGVAIREVFFGLNRRWAPEPTDAEVSARVAGILKSIGVRRRGRRKEAA
jgi:hypothetical protein